MAPAALLVLLMAGLAAAQTTLPVSSPPPAPPPPPPSLADIFLPPGRGYDWSLAGYKDGLEPIPFSQSNVLNVRLPPYNAVGDSVADDTAAILQAVKDANAAASGAIIYLPRGRYILKQPFEIRRANVVIRGDGQGATTLNIPVSLSDVYKGTWVQKPDGSIKSAWSSGGAFIQFSAGVPRSSNSKTLLASVVGTLPPRSRVVPVSSTDKFSIGQWIVVFVNDYSTKGGSGGMRRRLAGAGGAYSAPGLSVFTDAATGRNTTVLRKPVPPSLKASPAFQAAMEGMALLDEPDEAGITPQQAAESDAAAAARFTHASGEAGIAAAPGTVASWVYGDGVADSGPSTGVFQADQVAMSAKVVAIGPGWVQLDRELPFPVLKGWSALVHQYNRGTQGCGVERLTIEFNWTVVGPHFTDRGYNAIQMRGLANSWVRDVTILNADNGIFFNWVDHSTVQGVVVDVTQMRWNTSSPVAYKEAINGHHPVCLGMGHSNHVFLTRIPVKYQHDLTVCYGELLDVWERISGLDVNIDNHRAGPWANLFTDIDVGYGTRWYFSGGKPGRGAYTGSGATFWNLRATGWAPPPPPRPKPSPPPPPRPPRPPRSPPPSPANLGSSPPPAERLARSPPPPVVRSPPPKAPVPVPRQRPPGLMPRRAMQAPAIRGRGLLAGQGASLGASAASGEERRRQQLAGGAPARGSFESGGSGRQLLTTFTVKSLPLPPCEFGPFINFYGSFTGTVCPKMAWLLLPLNASLPDNLWFAQRAYRRLTPTP